MIYNLLWKGRENLSLENCRILLDADAVTIDSVVIGRHVGEIFRVHYIINTDDKWRTRKLDVRCIFGTLKQQFNLESSGNGTWKKNGEVLEQFQGCIDLDIPLTPFTNSLPIKRLNLDVGQEQIVKVIYIDLLQEDVSVRRQKYLRISERLYHYENIPNDFEADIEVDANGFVVDYPGLFKRDKL